MTDDLWSLFPFPTLTVDGTVDGACLAALPLCISCPTRQCLDDLDSKVAEIQECRFGVSYARIDEVRLLTGVVATGLPTMTNRARKIGMRDRSRRVHADMLRRSIGQARSLGAGVVSGFDTHRDELIKRLETNPELHEALADKLRRDFADNLNQSHDFLQLVKLVRGHAETLLHNSFPALSPQEAADRLPTEGAIYYSTELMLVKMDSLVFLNEINRAHGDEGKFQIHPLVVKYVRIYDWQARQKELRIVVDGKCYGFSVYNTYAIGAVVQGLLDNMVKYAPAMSSARVAFAEDETGVTLSFASLGPKIEHDERRGIFLPKFRAKAARAQEAIGLGVGLAIAMKLSDALDLDLRVEQETEEDSRFAGRYQTVFTFRLETS